MIIAQIVPLGAQRRIMTSEHIEDHSCMLQLHIEMMVKSNILNDPTTFIEKLEENLDGVARLDLAPAGGTLPNTPEGRGKPD